MRFVTSLVVQWLRIQLPMQGTWVWSLVQEDPTCYGTTNHAQLLSPNAPEPMLCSKRSHHSENPTRTNQDSVQPKCNKIFFNLMKFKQWDLSVLWESWKVSDTSMPHQMIDRYTNTAREGRQRENLAYTWVQWFHLKQFILRKKYGCMYSYGNF